MWQEIFGIIAALGLAALLVRQFLDVMARQKAAPALFFEHAKAVLDDARISSGPAVGTHQLTGRYKGHAVQVKAITDTLAVRKLPSQWLMVTIPENLPVTATFDMMMRPAGPTTFSNFDGLPFTVERPPDFPEHAVLRTDNPDQLLPSHVVAPHLVPFFGPGPKELLITPSGIRMVSLLAEADRARYGVFRQADFGGASLDAATLVDHLERLLALREAIENWHSQHA
jgi:hypothetical protein